MLCSKFGIYGTIGVIIVDKSKNNLIIKNFLMAVEHWKK